MVDGTLNTFFEAGQAWLEADQLFGKPEIEKVRRVRDRVFVREQAPQILAVMTDLYADPANAYVALIDMVFIACDNLEGRSIDGRLAE